MYIIIVQSMLVKYRYCYLTFEWLMEVYIVTYYVCLSSYFIYTNFNYNIPTPHLYIFPFKNIITWIVVIFLDFKDYSVVPTNR